MFKPATKAKSKLRMAIIGPSGSGKTLSGLAIASHLGERVAVIDTEYGSASLYADRYKFDVAQIEDSFEVDKLVTAIREADKAGYDAILVDSLTHFWQAKGGILEVVGNEAAKMKNPNTYVAWRKGDPLYNKLVQTILGCRAHIICTIRSKQAYSQEKNEDGRTEIRKVGMAPVQRDSIEYEFGIVGEMDVAHTMHITKSRCSEIADKTFPYPGKDVADILIAWLNDGTAYVPPTPKPLNETPTGGRGDASTPAGDIVSPAQCSQLMRLNADWSSAQVIAYIKSEFNLDNNWNKNLTVPQFDIAKAHIQSSKPPEKKSE